MKYQAMSEDGNQSAPRGAKMKFMYNINRIEFFPKEEK